MRDDATRLGDILAAIDRIERHTPRSRAVFEQNELLQIWVVHHLQIIGESAARISHDARSRYPRVPWQQMIAMRNILVHDYFRVDVGAIWATLERDLPQLKARIAEIVERGHGTS